MIVTLLLFQVTGDPGKTAAVLRNLSKFGIKELARTGKVRKHSRACYMDKCTRISLQKFC